MTRESGTYLIMPSSLGLLYVEKCDRFDAGSRRRGGVPQIQSANQLKALQCNEVSRSKDVGIVSREMGSKGLLQYAGALPSRGQLLFSFFSILKYGIYLF